MKNRALLLCLKNKIEYVSEYALKIGVSISQAKNILEEKEILSNEIVKRNCLVFNVTPEYFLCVE